MTQELAIRELRAPAEVVANATEQAKVLMDIVNQTHCYQTIGGKKYLQVEAWETIGAFNRIHAVTDSITPIIRDGESVGYDAKVNLFNQDGFVVGGAIMSCYFTENACKGKQGDAKDKACKSAAQTFATSKAYRMNYSYVAILAGYEPTPAEEMTGSDTTQPNRSEHFCEAHGVSFFKSGKMKAFAHPIGDTGKWCHESKNKTESEDGQTTANASVSSQEGQGTAEKPEVVESDGAEKKATEKDLLIGLVIHHLKLRGDKTAVSALSWMLNVAKIPQERIDNEPAKVAQELIEKHEWK